MDEHLRILEEEYCPPIDPGLISAIYHDFAGQDDAIRSTRELLETLKVSAAAEQLTEFEPSGYRHINSHDTRNKDADSTGDARAMQTISTDCSTVLIDTSKRSLGGRSGTSSDSSQNGGYFQEADCLDTATKELMLIETFPSLRLDKIVYTLKKCGNDYSKATDELLNQVYFEDTRTTPTEDGPVAKGIDAFSEEYHVPQRGKKTKAKKKQRLSAYSDTTAGSSESDLTPTNRWLNTSQDVDFIAARTNLSKKAVSSIYHANSASLSATILAIVRKDMETHRKDGMANAVLVQAACDLNADFRSVNLNYCLAIIRLTAPSTAKAHELAKALTQQPASETSSSGGIRLDLRYAPVDVSEPGLEESKLPALAPSARSRDLASTVRARNEAFQQASAAYRKGKSTPLMKAAAGYYAQEGRDLNANLKSMSAAEADAFVSSQSGPTYLDLHGVIVADATRIAKQRTKAWWDGLGEQKISEWSGPGRRDGGEVYKIITGLGRHSEGGRGKLGPAVAKALASEGWKLEIRPGELFVTGLARRK